MSSSSQCFRVEGSEEGTSYHSQAAAAALIHVGGNDYSGPRPHITLGKFEGSPSQALAFKAWLEARVLGVPSVRLSRVEFEPDHLGPAWAVGRRELCGVPVLMPGTDDESDALWSISGASTAHETPASCRAVYELAKSGNWAEVGATLRGLDTPARRTCLAYTKPASGWTVMHQAAYFGDDHAVAMCLLLQECEEAARAGPAWALLQLSARAHDGRTPGDVAEVSGHAVLAARLRATVSALSGATTPPRTFPAAPPFFSNVGSTSAGCRACTAGAAFPVLYGGGIVVVAAGAPYWALEETGAVVVGWHGTVSPPCDMDGAPLL